MYSGSVMDFHFYTQNKPSRQGKGIRKTLLTFLPLFILAGILPVALALVKNPVTTRFQSQAAENDLTIWLTPANVVTDAATPVELTVHAHFDSANLIPGVKFPVNVDGTASVKNPEIDYIKPFNGEVTLGTVTVQPIKKGELTVSINPDSVKSETFQEVFHVFVSPAKIIVQ